MFGLLYHRSGTNASACSNALSSTQRIRQLTVSVEPDVILTPVDSVRWDHHLDFARNIVISNLDAFLGGDS